MSKKPTTAAETSNFCIYMHTSPSGKSYIGQTQNYKQRTARHKNGHSSSTAFHNAIIKYGWSRFKSKILIDGLNLEEANDWEKFLIYIESTLSPNGYNLMSGGMNSIPSDETRARMSVSQRNKKPASEDTLKRLSAMNKGRVHTEAAKLNMKEAAIKRGISLETREKIRTVLIGRKLSEEHKEKLKGRVISDETRKKLSGRTISDHQKEIISNSSRNRIWSQESKERLSISSKNKPPCTDDTRNKMSIAAKNRHLKSRQEKHGD